MTGYPYRYERSSSISELRGRFGDIESGSETGTEARVAGRVMSMRRQGKVAFADLRQGSDQIQLFAHVAVLGEDGMDRFSALSVGDIVGASGEVMMTRRGELSIKVAEATVLAECLRPMPEKWHGITDVEVRHRQRYLDLLLNPQMRQAVEARATVNAVVRRFFDDRGFIEVETPLLQPVAGGAVARPFSTHHNALDIELFLRIAPELYLKRLLIGGLDRVYELNRVFRNEGISSQHNPEFTMLEAYEAYVDYEDTMSLVEDLVRTIARALDVDSFDRAGEMIDLTQPFERVTMFEAIQRTAGVDLGSDWDPDDREAMARRAAELDVRADPEWGPGKILLEIFEATTEKKLTGPIYITGMPKEISPLAKDHRSIPGFTEHADLVIGGIEIAPCYSELNDPVEQRRRFEQQAAARAAGDEEAALPDEDFLEALSYGMPPAGGFGLGIDRLLMLLLALPSIREVVLFPTLKPE